MRPADLRALAEFVPTAGAPAQDTTAGEEARSRMTDLLYQEWFLQATKPASVDGPLQPVELDAVGALEAAHVLSGRFELGWRAQRSSNAGRVQAHEESPDPELQLTRTLRLGDYINLAAPGHRPRAGDPLAVGTVHAEVEDGFWVCRNKQWWGLSARGALPPLTRVYFNVDLAHASTAVQILSGALNDWGGPHAFKVSLGLDELQRPDSVVLYAPRDRFHGELHALLAPAVRALDDHEALGEACPRLTARLHRGVGAADGDADGASFGTDRCRLVADALLSVQRVDDIESLVDEAFRKTDLDPARPYLERGETRDYVAFDRAG